MSNYPPLAGEGELREAAFAANVSLHINSKARRECAPCVELFSRIDRTVLLGTFKSCSEAVAFLEGKANGF